jgi:hypothetical protein
MQALDEFLAAYEAEHGEITDDEMRAATRRARERASSCAPHRRRDGERRERGPRRLQSVIEPV